MKPRFQADADLHFDIVLGVLRREAAIDFQSAQELLPDGTADLDVLRLSAQDGRILVSHDVRTMPVHFRDFMNRDGGSPGVFLVSQSVAASSVIEELILIWTASDASEWSDRLTWLPL